MSNKDWVYLISLQLLMLLIYGLTVSPTVNGGDSGELMSVAYALGVAHPPGYPLYTLLAHLMTFLPFANAALAINLFSAVCCLGAVSVLFLMIRRWTENPMAAFFAAGLFAFAPLVWRYAVVSEVFGLQLFLVALMVYCYQRFCEEAEIHWLYWLSFVIGLNFAHHHTSVFIALPLSLLVLLRAPVKVLKPLVVVKCLVLLSLGLLPYLYLPWASARNLLISWGDISSWQNFSDHFLRKDYGTLQLGVNPNQGGFWQNIFQYSLYTAKQLLWVGLVMVFFGIYDSWKKSPRPKADLFWGLVFSFFVYLVTFSYLANFDLNQPLLLDIQSRFWQVPLLIPCILAGCGFSVLKKMGRWPESLALIMALAFIGLQIGLHYSQEDFSKQDSFEQAGRSLLAPLPKNAVLLTRGDGYVNSVRYLQTVQSFRRDVIAIPIDSMVLPWMTELIRHNHPGLRLPAKTYWPIPGKPETYTLKELFEQNIRDHEIFITKLHPLEQKTLSKDFDFVEVGFALWMRPRGSDMSLGYYKAIAEPFSKMTFPNLANLRVSSWEFHLFRKYWARQESRAVQLVDVSFDMKDGMPWLQEGVRILKRVASEYPLATRTVYKNLAVAYSRMSKENEDFVSERNRWLKKYLSIVEQLGVDELLPGEQRDLEAIRRLLKPPNQ